MSTKSYLYQIEHIQMCYEQPRSKEVNRDKSNKYPCRWHKHHTIDSCPCFAYPKAGDRKWVKNVRNRYLRRCKIDEEILDRYKYRYGYEY